MPSQLRRKCLKNAFTAVAAAAAAAAADVDWFLMDSHTQENGLNNYDYSNLRNIVYIRDQKLS